MDGFVITNAGNHEAPAPGLELIEGERAMAYYTQADIPLTYFLAQNFSIGDRYFASTPTQTWPNRAYLFAATSFGESNNDFPSNVDKTIFDYLNERGVTWKFYATAVPTMGIVTLAKIGDYSAAGNLVNIADFAVDAANGNLPQVAFVDPDGTSTPDIHHSDEHPPSIMQIGQKWLGEIIDALSRSSQWDRSAMFITYDEHGGLYDHVLPPPACPPDDRYEEPGVRFTQYGVRVPFLVVSPFAKRGYVSHAVYDHTSILRFVEARFVIPALTNRDANAEAPWDVFDFDNPPNAERPVVPIPVVDQAKLAACDTLWGI
jgi:phospholipase C